MNEPVILTADGHVSIARALFDRTLETLRFVAQAADPYDRARASERAALLLIDLEAMAPLNAGCADICRPDASASLNRGSIEPRVRSAGFNESGKGVTR